MNIENSCAFTGHRPAHFAFGYNENHPDCIALKEEMRKEVIALIEVGVTTYYSGMALGVDIWGVELVLELKKEHPELELIAVLPCETQANRWSDTQRERYFSLLPSCDEVIYVSRHYTPTCVLDRNRYMLDHAKHLLAVYDGRENGGTAHTVTYAKKKEHNIIIIPAAK